jgi:hypothetical protein
MASKINEYNYFNAMLRHSSFSDAHNRKLIGQHNAVDGVP